MGFDGTDIVLEQVGHPRWDRDDIEAMRAALRKCLEILRDLDTCKEEDDEPMPIIAEIERLLS